MAEKKPVVITRLEASNVKRLRAVQVDPRGNVVTVGGRNAQGKSSLLDSILYALAGPKAIPDEPVRRGEEGASVRLTLSNGMVVERYIAPNGQAQLTLRSAEGAHYPKAQTTLDELAGASGGRAMLFDPLAFSRQSPREQVATLRAALGLDTAELDKRRNLLFAQRTEVGRRRDHAKEVLAEYPEPKDGDPVEKVEAAAIMEELDQADRLYRQVENHDAALAAARDELTRRQRRAEELEEELEAMRRGNEELSLRVSQLEEEPQPVIPDREAIRARLVEVDEVNAVVARNAKRAARAEEYAVLREEYGVLTRQIGEVDKEKAKLVAAVRMPLPDLEFDEEQVRYQGTPLQECSASEKIRACTAIALAGVQGIEVLLVREGALMDQDAMAALAAVAQEHGAQVWVEVVGGGAQITIEDGSAVQTTKEEGR